MKTSTLIVVFISLIMISCSNDDPLSKDCTFVDNPSAEQGAISEQEVQLMADCDNDPLTTVEQVTDRLSGTAWTLVGFGHGWFWETNKPCITIDFNDTEVGIEYVDSQRDTVTSHTWEVEEVSNGTLRLVTEPPMYELGMTNFSEEIMYHNGTPYDGNLYIYAKLD